MSCFPLVNLGPTSQHEIGHSSAEAIPLHPLIHLQLPPLSTTQGQGKTLELERERSGEWIGEGKEEEEGKHQQHLMDTINIFNLIHGELKKSSSYFLDFSPKA